MPAYDLYHHAVVQSLKADGWTITYNPLYIAYGGRNLFADLGAEREAIVLGFYPVELRQYTDFAIP
jgi:hypothetical protein